MSVEHRISFQIGNFDRIPVGVAAVVVSVAANDDHIENDNWSPPKCLHFAKSLHSYH